MRSEERRDRGADPRPVPKLMGADAELGNLVLGVFGDLGTGREASRALLHEIDGVSGTAVQRYSAALSAPWGSGQEVDTRPLENPQDIGRRYLASNGGCVYIDLDHLELCTPEVASAADFVAAWHAMLRIARDALGLANSRRPDGQRIVVLVNSSDGRGNAYGSHLNFLVTRQLWDDLFLRRLHPGLFVLAAHQISSIVYTGQGKVGAENGRPPVPYQITQRGDFFDQLVGAQTTYDRPVVNSRDEPLCGMAQRGTNFTRPDPGLARLHCIFYDSTLCHVSTLLKVGTMQIVLSMLEAGNLDTRLMLDHPLEALTAFGHDTDLGAKARLTDGRSVTAVELQSMFCEQARAHVDAGGCESLVPGAADIVALWEDTLTKLSQRDFDALAPRLDWVLKRSQIERALTSRGLDWAAPQAKHLDHLYASLDVDEGLYWALEGAGLTDTRVDAAYIEHLRHTPPANTRAWRRAMLLRRLPPERLRRVDWDRIDVESTDPEQGVRILDLGSPLGHTGTDPATAHDGGLTIQTVPAGHSLGSRYN